MKIAGHLFSRREDFGIAPIEAMACESGLAYRKGGLTETVIEGETGEFLMSRRLRVWKLHNPAPN